MRERRVCDREERSKGRKRKEGNTHSLRRPPSPPLSHPAAPLRLCLISSDPNKFPRSLHVFDRRTKLPNFSVRNAFGSQNPHDTHPAWLSHRNVPAPNTTDTTNPPYNSLSRSSRSSHVIVVGISVPLLRAPLLSGQKCTGDF